jgi:dUTP pyrophosphatase
MKVKIVNLSKNSLPRYETANSAGLDVRVDLALHEYHGDVISNTSDDNGIPILRYSLRPGARGMLKTGLYMEIEEGYEAQVRARSGLAIKTGIALANGVGTIDADYRGECNILVINHSSNNVYIEDGERIAQFIFNKVEHAIFEQVEGISDLNTTNRGSGGFGHTGTK